MKDLLLAAYSEDPTYIKQFHYCAGQSVEACVDQTVAELKRDNATINLVKEAGEVAGFFAVIPDCGMNSFNLKLFFLSPEYRRTGLAEKVLQRIVTLCQGYTVKTAVLAHNTPINRFYSRLDKPLLETTEVEGKRVNIYLIHEGAPLWQ